MAIIAQDGNGKRYTILPSHDPDQQDHGLALELAVDRTREGVIDAARTVEGHYTHLGTNNDLLGLLTLIRTGLRPALAGYDAAVAENRAHDSLVQP